MICTYSTRACSSAPSSFVPAIARISPDCVLARRTGLQQSLRCPHHERDQLLLAPSAKQRARRLSVAGCLGTEIRADRLRDLLLGDRLLARGLVSPAAPADRGCNQEGRGAGYAAPLSREYGHRDSSIRWDGRPTAPGRHRQFSAEEARGSPGCRCHLAEVAWRGRL